MQNDYDYIKIQQGELIQVISDCIKNESEQRFCFILGAGASKQSGIPTAGELANGWLSQLLESNNSETLKWLSEKSVDKEKIAEFYSDVYEYRFRLNPQSGFDTLIKHMDGKFPSYGYSVLAQILTNTRNNIVLTTNFDNLSEQAVYYYTSNWPLIIGHENLAEYARPSNRRPLIAKLHRDLLLGPFNTKKEIQVLQHSWEIILSDVFTQCIPVFIGYGGNDGSLMSYLEKLKRCQNFFWCIKKDSEPKKEILELLAKQCGKLVEIDGFDELFFMLGQSLNYDTLHDEISNISLKRLQDYEKSLKQLSDRINREGKSEYVAAVNNVITNIQTREIPTYTIDELREFINKSQEKLSSIKSFIHFDNLCKDVEILNSYGNKTTIKTILEDEIGNIKYLLDFRLNKSKRTIDDCTNKLNEWCRTYQRQLNEQGNNDVKVKPIMVVRHDLQRIGSSNRGIPVLKFNLKENSFTNLKEVKQALEKYE